MVKLRNAYYCNLKVMLIWLVIFCHWIEPELQAEPALYRLYLLIYRFHMPLFAFVSGLFLKDSAGCIRQFRRMLPVYLICQGGAALLGLTPWHTPLWILWYLLSLCFWLLGGALLLMLSRGRWLFLVLAFAAGCLSGTVKWIGRPFSLSRTLVFFPYFWLGVLLPPDTPWRRFRFLTVFAPFLLRPVSASTLYHAGSCHPLLRLECYVCAAALGLCVLSWCPERRFPWSRAGADTMPAYLLHGPVTALLRPTPFPALSTTFFLYIIHKATQWHRLYGIIGKGDCPWPHLKKSTTPRASRFTGSSCP